MSKSATEDLVWHDVNEEWREYHLMGGETIVFRNVRRIAISPRGTHRLETLDGLKHIVKADIWTHVTFLSSVGWSF